MQTVGAGGGDTNLIGKGYWQLTTMTNLMRKNDDYVGQD